jgi:hypothetical protein
MRQIEIEWVELKIKVAATLADDRNGDLCDLLWDHLPYRSIQNHALVSGEHLYHLSPIRELVYTPAASKEDRRQSQDGTVFLSHLQHLAIKYGLLTEPISAAPVAYVSPDHIPMLKEAGRRCWDRAYRSKEVIEVRVTRRGEPTDRFTLPRAAPVKNREAQEVIDAIQNEMERIWVVPPLEVLDIHDGRIRSRAGSYDQYFATLVFVNGETRPLGYCAMGGLIKSCVSSDISLDTLRQITPNFIRVPAEFLSYCGFEALFRFTQDTLRVLGALETKDEYVSLLSTLALYTNRLNGWNLHYFPWKHGEEYRYAPMSTRPASSRRGQAPRAPLSERTGWR